MLTGDGRVSLSVVVVGLCRSSGVVFVNCLCRLSPSLSIGGAQALGRMLLDSQIYLELGF
jgi:hypothetical protein